MEFKDGRPVVAYNHRLLVLFDEFPAFGKLENFEKQLSFVAGYGIKVLLIVQSLNQLFKTYGPNNSIIDNCHVRVVFTPNTDETAERVSRMLGKATELVQSQSFSGNRLNPWLTNASYSTQEIGRALMTPEEVMVLPYDEEIIFITGFPPIKSKKLFYYEDNNFTQRLKPEPSESDRCCDPVETQQSQLGYEAPAEQDDFQRAIEPSTASLVEAEIDYMNDTINLAFGKPDDFNDMGDDKGVSL